MSSGGNSSAGHSEKKIGRKKSCEFMLLFFLLRSLLTTVLRRTQNTGPKSVRGRPKRTPPLQVARRDTLLLWMLSAHRQRSQQAQSPVEAAHLAKRCSPCCGWPGAVIASTNAACQRNKAKASMQFTPGRAAVQHQRGWARTKGGYAYTVKYE